MEWTWENAWYQSKTLLEAHIGLSKDLMHVHFGLGVFLIGSLILRKYRYGMVIAWGGLVLLQLVNEAMDARDWIIWTGSVNWQETIKDCFSTLFWPTVLLVSWGYFSRRT